MHLLCCMHAPSAVYLVLYVFGVHVCFSSTLTRNIRHRRGDKVVINVPSKSNSKENYGFAQFHTVLSDCMELTLCSVSVFKDKCTQSPFGEEFPEDDGEAARAALPDHIYMDAMGFGMGNCCLQVLNAPRSAATILTDPYRANK